MPVLEREPSLFPDMLLDDGFGLESERHWMVLYTRARQEKAISRELLRRQIPFYLPLVQKTLQYARRQLSSHSPLFAGYLFVFGTPVERTGALATNRVSRVLEVEDSIQLVHDLRQLRHLIATNAPLTVESRLEPGNRVRVKKGAFAGLEGIVLHRRGQTRLLVSVNFLQRGASVEIDDFLLEPLD